MTNDVEQIEMSVVFKKRAHSRIEPNTYPIGFESILNGILC